MKITHIDCTVIYARRNTAFGRVTRTALGPASISEHALVRVHTDAGVTGLGEVCSVFEKKGRDYAEEINQKLAERLIDEDPFEITRHLSLMESLLPDSQPAHAAIDMALHDIVDPAQLFNSVRDARRDGGIRRGTGGGRFSYRQGQNRSIARA